MRLCRSPSRGYGWGAATHRRRASWLRPFAPGCGHVQVAELGTAKGRLRHLSDRHPQSLVEPALGGVPLEGPAPEARHPEAAFGVHAEAVWDALSGQPDQGPASADGPVVEVVVEDVDGGARGVHEVHQPSVGTPVDPVGDRHPLDHPRHRSVRLQAIERTHLRTLVLGHRPRPEASSGVRGAVVHPLSRLVGLDAGDKLNRRSIENHAAPGTTLKLAPLPEAPLTTSIEPRASSLSSG
jgi:hypothetical protein